MPWTWAGQGVQVQAEGSLVEVWSGEQRLAMHPRAAPRTAVHTARPVVGVGTRGFSAQEGASATQVEEIEVQQRPLDLYQALVVGGQR